MVTPLLRFNNALPAGSIPMFLALALAIAVHALLLWFLWERVAPEQTITRKKSRIYGIVALVLFVVPFCLGRATGNISIIAIASAMAVLPAGILCYFLMISFYDAVANRIIQFKNRRPKE